MPVFPSLRYPEVLHETVTLVHLDPHSYRFTRNPMYAAPPFLAGLALSTASPVAAGLLGWHVRWFSDRVRKDERRLREQFGPAYDEYCARTPRWVPRVPAKRVR